LGTSWNNPITLLMRKASVPGFSFVNFLT
jgi:hypothetical protein